MTQDGGSLVQSVYADAKRLALVRLDRDIEALQDALGACYRQAAARSGQDDRSHADFGCAIDNLKPALATLYGDRAALVAAAEIGVP